jgi:uncharacterized membrane protein YbhN (UPF0104 family)
MKETMTSPMLSGWRAQALVLSVIAAAAGYLIISLVSGWANVSHAVRLAGYSGIACALALSLVNYAARFTRWQTYLAAMGHHLPLALSGCIYVTGFALTTTPGKAGEAVRSLFLKQLGVDYTDSLAAMFSERLSDLLAVVVFVLAGVSEYPPARGPILGAAVILVFIPVALSQEGWRARLARLVGAHHGRLAHITGHALRLLGQARRCNGLGTVLIALGLGLLAWGAEAVAFHIIAVRLGIAVDLRFCLFTYSAALLAGAITVMPGGLGGTEATMIALLMLRGATLSQAVAATLIIRLSTLWFAVLLGAIAFGFSRKHVPA